jgi:hypothetical protein
MGLIKQLSTEKHLIPLESKSINITQWKLVMQYGENICVWLEDSLYTIYNMSIDLFHEINAENKTVYFKFEYTQASLRCPRCAGTGIIDWLDKATKRMEKASLNLKNIPRYIRDKKGEVSVISDSYDQEIFSSVPNKKVGEEYCYECHGCGVKLLPSWKKVGTTSFDKC